MNIGYKISRETTAQDRDNNAYACNRVIFGKMGITKVNSQHPNYYRYNQ